MHSSAELLGRSNPIIIRIITNIALLYWNQEWWDEALVTLEYVAKVWISIHGGEHLNVVKAPGNLERTRKAWNEIEPSWSEEKGRQIYFERFQ